MLTLSKVSKTFVWLGAAALIFTAIMHLYLGFPFVARSLSEGSLSLAVSGAMKAMWIAFSSHLFIVSALLAIYAFKDGAPQRFLIFLCGIVPLIDALLLTVWVSAAHIGVILLSASGALILIGGGITLFLKIAVLRQNITSDSIV